jgi:hypothetical protein
MVNDDCTLVVLRVGGASAEPSEPIAEEIGPDREAERAVAAAAHDEAGPPVEPITDEQEKRDEQEAQAAPRENGHREPVGSGSFPEAIAADVGDLMLDVPHDPPGEGARSAQDGADAPRSPEHVEPPPAVEPPATRDGFPESTDPRV